MLHLKIIYVVTTQLSLTKKINVVLCLKTVFYTVEPLITDPPRYGHPLYNGRMLGTDRYSHISSACIFILRDTDIANGQASELRTTDLLPNGDNYYKFASDGRTT